MRITMIAEYGVICAIHLARRAGTAVSVRALADAEQLPADSAEQVLMRLRRAGVVRSTRGAHGGYELARPPALISIRDVVAASEESAFELNCTSHPVDHDRCSPDHGCSIRPVWMLLQQKIDQVLASVSLADLLAQETQVQTLIGLTRRARNPDAPRGPELATVVK
jgi:Rrf2 family transcriptional regulator, iron-sulfur cluster assembly transcription factor